MYEKALKNRELHTYKCTTMEEIHQALTDKGDGFVLAPWCGCEECEDEVKAQTGIGSRCIYDDIKVGDKCICCGKEAQHTVVWAKAY